MVDSGFFRNFVDTKTDMVIMMYKIKKQQHEIKRKCETLAYIDADGTKVMRPKKAFATDKEAIEAARRANLKPTQIHKLVAYKCPECGKWHIGRNFTKLTPKDREHYRNVKTSY